MSHPIPPPPAPKPGGPVAPPRQLMTIRDVCDYTRFERKYVERATRRGELRGHQHGRSWRFYPSDVDAWVRSGTKRRHLRTA